MSRIVVLDTETTGLDPAGGHRIIEIGCVELLKRRVGERRFHHYLNPERAVDAGAAQVHGISTEDLVDQPLFAELADEFLDFIHGAELVIHNAPFDVGFLDMELARLGGSCRSVTEVCQVTDTLVMARQQFPGQRVSLDAMCKRLGVDNSSRQLHGALLDAQLLAEVYLAMTVGQGSLDLASEPVEQRSDEEPVATLAARTALLPADADEVLAHEKWLDELDQACPQGSVWRRGVSDSRR